MQAVMGAECVLRIRNPGDGPEMHLIEGVVLTELEICNSPVDITDGDNVGWRMLLSNAGIRQLRLKAAGTRLGSAAELHLRDVAVSGASELFELQLGNGQSLSATMIVERLQYAAGRDDELGFEVTLTSTGPVQLN